MLAIAVIPFAGELTIFGVRTTLSITDLDISRCTWSRSAASAIYGVILGGWSSNSKYSLLGGLRASAQMVSYELSLILAMLAVVVLAGSLDLRVIVADQAGSILQWNLWRQPLAFFLFLVAAFAECNRHPFDFAECEPSSWAASTPSTRR
jgi:NADH-quinone oxidoreductase subunit H